MSSKKSSSSTSGSRSGGGSSSASSGGSSAASGSSASGSGASGSGASGSSSAASGSSAASSSSAASGSSAATGLSTAFGSSQAGSSSVSGSISSGSKTIASPSSSKASSSKVSSSLKSSKPKSKSGPSSRVNSASAKSKPKSKGLSAAKSGIANVKSGLGANKSGITSTLSKKPKSVSSIKSNRTPSTTSTRNDLDNLLVGVSGAKEVKSQDEMKGYKLGQLIVDLDDYYRFYSATKNDGERILCKVVVLDKCAPRYRDKMIKNNWRIEKFVGGAADGKGPKSPYYVRVYEVFMLHNEAYVFMEECPEKSLYLRLVDHSVISPELTRTWMRQLLSGLEQLQNLSIAHRFLKPHHILFSEENKLKIGGWSRAMVYSQNIDTRMADKEARSHKNNHLPPECFKGHYDVSLVDMWSTGVLMMNIATNRYPFDPTNDMKASTQWRRFVEQHATNDYMRAACNQCFFIDPSRRHSPSKLAQHEYFSVSVASLTPTRKADKDDKSGRYTPGAEKSMHLSEECADDDDTLKNAKPDPVQPAEDEPDKGTEYKAEAIHDEPKNSKHYSLHSQINKAVTIKPKERAGPQSSSVSKPKSASDKSKITQANKSQKSISKSKSKKSVKSVPNGGAGGGGGGSSKKQQSSTQDGKSSKSKKSQSGKSKPKSDSSKSGKSTTSKKSK